MTAHLNRDYMRPFQFVETFAEPSLDMLFENFIRGSGIYCRENQKAIDGIIPVAYPSADVTMRTEGEASDANNVSGVTNSAKKQVIKVDQLRGLLVQAKLRKKYQTPKDKDSWMQDISTLDILKTADRTHPWVALFVEVGGPAESESPRKTEKPSGLPFEVTETDFDLAIIVRINRLSQIDPEAGDADASFQRLLDSLIDPADCSYIEEAQRSAIRRMFKSQPYMCRKMSEVNPQR